MKLFAIILVSVLLKVAGGQMKKESSNLSRDCIVRFMQIKGELEDSFQSSPAPSELCRVLLPLIYANHSEKLLLKLWETKSVKAQCVFERLKNSQLIDLELKLEIYSHSKHLTRNVKRKRMYEVMINQRKLLLEAARICRSDKTYGGLFDQILGINSSIALHQENYCLLKYVVDNRFIDIPDIPTNPMNINTLNFDCRSIIETKKRENERKLLEAFQQNKYSGDAIECLLERYRHENIFGWNTAKNLLTKIEIVVTLRVAEDTRISKILSEFNHKSTNCLFSFNWELFSK